MKRQKANAVIPSMKISSRITREGGELIRGEKFLTQ